MICVQEEWRIEIGMPIKLGNNQKRPTRRCYLRGKKHLIIMQLSRADQRGIVGWALASNVAETTAALRIQFSKTWRRGDGRGGREGVGKPLSHKPLSHPQLRTQLVGALNFLCMNYDVRNSWLVSHQNEAPISAQGLETQMPLSS